MSSNVFIGDHILMDVCLDSATRQLGRLARDGVLLSASEHAYGEGVTSLVETAGLAPGMSRLVGVQPGDLVETEGCARLWLRWEAIGSDGTLFPALDADLTLSPAGENTTLLTLAGVYRLPEHAGAGLDPASCAASPSSPSTALSPGSPVLSCIRLAQRFPAAGAGQNSRCRGPEARSHDGPDTHDDNSAIRGGRRPRGYAAAPGTKPAWPDACRIVSARQLCC
jgi:hypothetical protein